MTQSSTAVDFTKTVVPAWFVWDLHQNIFKLSIFLNKMKGRGNLIVFNQ